MAHGRRRGNNDFDDFLNDDREQQPELPIPPELLMLLGAPPTGNFGEGIAPLLGNFGEDLLGGLPPADLSNDILPPQLDIGGGQSPTGGPGGSRVPPLGKPPAPPGSFTPPNLGPGGPGPQPGGPFQQIPVPPGLAGGIPPDPTVGPGGPGPQPPGPPDRGANLPPGVGFISSDPDPIAGQPPDLEPGGGQIQLPPNGQRGPGKPDGGGPGRGVPPGSAFDVPNIQNRPQTPRPPARPSVTGSFGPGLGLEEILRALGLNLPGQTGHIG